MVREIIGAALIAALSPSLPAHVSVLDGRATIARTEGGTVVALRNAPLLAGDGFVTATGARAEIQFDGSVTLRLDGGTQVQIVSLATYDREIRLVRGTIGLAIAGNGDAPQIDTPSVVLRPHHEGLYRIAVGASGESIASAHSGTLSLITPNGTQLLDPGERVFVQGPAASPQFSYGAAVADDAFDRLNQTLDAAHTAANGAAHLPRALAGYANLAAYGTWVTLKPYGAAWSPHEFPGWAPYHDGRWFWRRGIGWTWISGESWGWLPYHYSGWIDDPSHGWCWIPPRAATWSPGNAIFFSVVTSGRTQSIGWVPLAPNEAFHAKLADYRNVHARGGVDLLSDAKFYAGDFSRLEIAPLDTLTGRIALRAPRAPAENAGLPRSRR